MQDSILVVHESRRFMLPAMPWQVLRRICSHLKHWTLPASSGHAASEATATQADWKYWLRFFRHSYPCCFRLMLFSLRSCVYAKIEKLGSQMMDLPGVLWGLSALELGVSVLVRA